MSMEARTEQFHTDAQRPKDKNTAKDIDKLRKFLFKNQAYRFTDRDQSHLFQAIQLYVTMYSSSPEPDSPALNLVEDALKLPFTVFTTGQKKSMLKWLDRLNGLEAAAAAGGKAASGTEQQQQYSVLDVTSDVAEVMNDEGETQQVQLAVCDPELVEALRRAFQAEQEVLVQLGTRHGKAAITKMTVQ
uniref:Translation initiation factor 5A C-terminal domain-containing protein n=1 Tax=Tetradesmus obliquus TaxID=3088 RepID=A0A383WFS1_TETOB|eukprot:jgi/Sobl393_1/19350/SZX76072.1